VAGYDVGDLIIRSANASILRGRRRADQSSVVLKVLDKTNAGPADVAALRREFELTQAIDSEHVIRVFDRVLVGDSLALVFDGVEAFSLRAAIAGGELQLEEKLHIAQRLALGLGAVHGAGIRHNDVTPGNVLVNRDSGLVKIIDFGLARATGPAGDQQLTGEIVGTLAYTAPEQTGRMNRKVDYRADLYSMGATLYHLFVGRPPFPPMDPLELLHAHMARRPIAPRLADKSVPEPVSDIIVKLLEKTAEDRYQTAQAVAADLQLCLTSLREHGVVKPFVLAQSDIPHTLTVSQKLYARDAEVKTILSAFDRVVGGASEAIFVHGPSGTGKSALVREIQRPVVSRRGYFVAGKFDQAYRDRPRSGFAQAFRSLVSQLLTEPQGRVALWRERFKESLGDEAGVVIQMVPELAHLVPDAPEVPELPPREAQARFSRLFRAFLRTVTSHGDPLVVFLDGLQWADTATVEIIGDRIMDRSIQRMLLVVAYRCDELTEGHALRAVTRRIKDAGLAPQRIFLQPLSQDDVGELLVDTVGVEAPDLAAVVFKKTGGNPYFVHEFLQETYDSGLLSFDHEARAWRWDLAGIEAQRSTGNVIDLLAARLKQLPDDTRRILATGAAIGIQFDIRTLAAACQLPGCGHRGVLKALLPAVDAGHLTPADSNFEPARALVDTDTDQQFCFMGLSLRFVHDRVQQAALESLAEADRLALHRTLGEELRSRLPAQGGTEIFDALNHLNVARSLITDDAGLYDLARLNLRGAEEANATAAFQAAYTYFDHAQDCLPDDSWAMEQRLSFDVVAGRLEALATLSRMDEAVALYDELAKRARGRAQRNRLHMTMIDVQTRMGNYNAAVGHARKALSFFDIKLPEEVSEVEADLAAAIARVERRLGGRSPMSLVDMEALDDGEQQAVVDVLLRASIPGFFLKSPLGSLMSVLLLDISLEYGVSGPTAYAAANYPAACRLISPGITDERRWSEAALKIADRFPDKAIFARLTGIVASANGPVLGLQTTLELVERGIEAATDIGDHIPGTFNRMLRVWLELLEGRPISVVQGHVKEAMFFAEQAGFADMKRELMLYRQYLRTYTGDTLAPDSLGSEDFDESELLYGSPDDLLKRADNGIRLMKARSTSMMGHPRMSWEASAPLTQMFDKYRYSTFSQLEHHFERGLAAAQLIRLEGDTDGTFRAAVEAASAMMAPFLAQNAVDYGPRHTLIQAEMADVDGDVTGAMRHYDDAIDGFAARAALRYNGMAQELAGRFYHRRGHDRIAAGYLSDARRLFRLFGATAKVAAMEAEFGPLLATRREAGESSSPASTTGSGGDGGALDLEAVVRGAQAVSGITHVDKLMDTLLGILVEQSGAERALLFVTVRGDWVLGGERTADQALDRLTTFVPLDEYDGAARSVVHYARRTQQSVRIDQASTEDTFARDPYIQEHKPRSILCLPCVHQGQVVAIIYLENRQAAAAFSARRTTVLEMVAAQAGVSLKNAMLVRDLRRATERLEQSNEALADYSKALEKDAEARFVVDSLAGESPAIRELTKHVEDVGPQDTTVLLLGERGTGKELVARRIHALSAGEGRFIKIRGSAVAADSAAWERTAMAEGGTLFLDGIGDLPRAFQQQLHERLSEGAPYRLVVSAGSDPTQLMTSGRLSEDLFYSIGVFPVRVPSLRERREDIPVLVKLLLERLAKKLGKTLEAVTEESLEQLKKYSWPGNVTELISVLERGAIVAESNVIDVVEGLNLGPDEGARLGSYQLVERIGAGGMGEVWRAKHALLRRPAAIKLVPQELFGAQDGTAAQPLLKRFEREAQATAALQSPNTVQLFDYGVSETGTFYYVMELLDGMDLESAIERFGPMPAERVVHILIQACRSLAEAHNRDLVHRDIKAANIYLCRVGLEVDVVKVLDFGLVRRVDDSDDETRLTQKGHVGGTPAYIAPETALDEGDVDARADLYALGCVAFWLLTGQLVFDAPSVVKLLLKHISEKPVAPSEISEMEIPEALDAIVMQLLEKDPDARPASARELMRLLEAVPLRHAWTGERAERWWGTHRPA